MNGKTEYEVVGRILRAWNGDGVLATMGPNGTVSFHKQVHYTEIARRTDQLIRAARRLRFGPFEEVNPPRLPDGWSFSGYNSIMERHLPARQVTISNGCLIVSEQDCCVLEGITAEILEFLIDADARQQGRK